MIKEIIYQGLLDEQKEKESKEQSFDTFMAIHGIAKKKEITFGPSYLTDCGRKIFYRKTNHPASNPIEPPAMLKMDLGNMIHEYVQNKLKKAKNIQWIEGEDYKTIEYCGIKWAYRIDNKIIISGQPVILEVKSTYMSGWQAIENEPKIEHILQLYAYMIFENVPYGILLYIGRDNGYMVEYDFTIDLMGQYAGELQERIGKLIGVRQSIEDTILPGRDFEACYKYHQNTIFDSFQKDKIMHKTSWQCSYCQWKKTCWQDVTDRMQKENIKFYINGEFIGG